MRIIKKILLGLLIGGTIGTLLCKTKRGKKIEAALIKKYHKLADEAAEFVHEKSNALKKQAKKTLSGHMTKAKKKKE